MGRATIEFKLPEEQEEYDCVMAAPRMDGAIRRIMREWRSARKYNTPAVTEKCWEILKDERIADLY